MEKLEATKISLILALSVLSVAVQAQVILLPTQKTSVHADSEVGYFGVEQLRSPSLPFVLCEEAFECQHRTTKTLAEIPSNAAGNVHQESEEYVVYFPFNSSVLALKEKDYLSSLFKQVNSDSTILVRGWTDPVGGETSRKNTKLAKDRVDAVVNYLMELNQNKYSLTIDKNYEPPCCVQSGTSKSPESVRKKMRIVQFKIVLNPKALEGTGQPMTSLEKENE